MSNIQAFLDMLAFSELGAGLLSKTKNGYNVLVGSTPDHPITFNDYSKHPHVFNARFNSTAAGRYQFIFRTWEHYRIKLNLPDFSPTSQDLACIEDLREHGAYEDILAGNITKAIQRCCNEWASLPGGNSGQHQNKLSDLIAAYKAAGGACGN